MRREIGHSGMENRISRWLPLLLLLIACDQKIVLPPAQLTLVPDVQPTPFSVERDPVNDIVQLLQAPDSTFFALDSGGAVAREGGDGWETIISIVDSSMWSEVVELLPLGRDDLLCLVKNLDGIQQLFLWNGEELVEQGAVAQEHVDLVGDRDRGIWRLSLDGDVGEISRLTSEEWVFECSGEILTGDWRMVLGEDGQIMMFNSAWMFAFVEDDSIRTQNHSDCIPLGPITDVIPAGGDRFHVVTRPGHLVELTPHTVSPIADPFSPGEEIFSAWAGEHGVIHMLVDIHADGYPRRMKIRTWQTGEWSTLALPNAHDVWTASGEINSGLWVGGYRGSRAFLPPDHSWINVEYRPGSPLYTLVERGGTWWATDGEENLLRKEPGGDWIKQGPGSSGGWVIIDLAVSGDGEIFGVKGSSRIYRWAGVGWSGVELPFGFTWQGVWSDAVGGVWACGSGGSLAHYVDGIWEEVIMGEGGEFRDGACIAERMMVVGRSGIVTTFDGKSWSQYFVPEASSFEDVVGGPDGVFYAVDEDGLLWCDLNRSTVLYQDTEAQPISLAITREGELWICGYDGLLASWSGEQSLPIIYNSGTTTLFSLVADGDGVIRIVGEGGVVLVYDPVSEP